MVVRNIPITIGTAVDGLSNAIDLEEDNFAGFIVSPGWDAAGLCFSMSTLLNGTYYGAYDDAGAEIKLNAAQVVVDRRVIFSDAMVTKLKAVRFLKLRSGTAAAPIQQSAPRVFTILAARVF